MKKVSATNLGNYQPMSLLLNLYKLFSEIIRNILIFWMKTNQTNRQVSGVAIQEKTINKQ